MTLKQLASAIAKLEGLKKQISVGNVREMIGLISDLLYANPELATLLIKNGQRRAKRSKN